MALPESVSTERTAYLQNIVKSASSREITGWPLPSEEQFALIGKFIVLYSTMDLFLRWFVEVLDRSGTLQPPWRGKTAGLTITDVEKAVRSAPDWSEENLRALELIERFRTVRNLAAHFAVKRFPNEDAFLFTTKSAKDFQKILGREPEPGAALTAVADISQFRQVLDRSAGLLEWLSKATLQIEREWNSSSGAT